MFKSYYKVYARCAVPNELYDVVVLKCGFTLSDYIPYWNTVIFFVRKFYFSAFLSLITSIVVTYFFLIYHISLGNFMLLCAILHVNAKLCRHFAIDALYSYGYRLLDVVFAKSRSKAMLMIGDIMHDAEFMESEIPESRLLLKE